MAKRSLVFVLAHTTMLLVSTAFPVGAIKAEPAAANCINKPNSAAPQGSHWFYRVDRETHRGSWVTVRAGKPNP
jgi:hypothetical protein